MMYKGIGISGPQRSGKDTLCAALTKSSPKYIRISFADELKRLATNLTGVNMFKEDNKIKHRAFLIALGQAMRAYDPLYWVNAVTPQIKEETQLYKHIPIITDLRFINEAEALRKMGFLLVRLDCDEDILVGRGWDSKYASDPSEAELNNYEYFDLRLNSGVTTPEALSEEVKSYLGA